MICSKWKNEISLSFFRYSKVWEEFLFSPFDLHSFERISPPPFAMFFVFFPSVFIPSSIIIIKSLHCYCGIERRWGLSAASQLVEQNKEQNGSFSSSSSLSPVFLSLFRLISFFPPRRTTFSLPNSKTQKRGICACAPSFFLPLCLSSVLLNNLTIFLFFIFRTQMTGANTYATCFRSRVVYFSYSSQCFFSLDMN